MYVCTYVHIYIYIYTYTSRRNFHRPHFKYKIVVSPQENVNFEVKKGVSESEGLTFAATCISTCFLFCGPRVFKVKTVAWYTLLLFSASHVGFPIAIGKIEYSERFFIHLHRPLGCGDTVGDWIFHQFPPIVNAACVDWHSASATYSFLHTPHSFAMVA